MTHPIVVVEEILCRFVGLVHKKDAGTFGRRRGIELMGLDHSHMANSVVYSVSGSRITIRIRDPADKSQFFSLNLAQATPSTHNKSLDP